MMIALLLAALVADCTSCPSMVAVPPLEVSATPVTFAEWRRCVEDGGCGGYRPDQQGWPDDAPVVNVSFDDAETYVRWLRRRTGRPYRLPTETEWPRLSLGGSGMRYSWGSKVGRGQTNCLDCGSRWDGRRASPVRAFPPNGFGLFDAAGNVAQWVVTDRSRCAGRPSYAAIAGASWADPSRFLDVRETTCFPRILRDDTIGFRVVVAREGR